MWSVAGDSSLRSLQELPVKGLNSVILSVAQIHTHCMLQRQNGYICRYGMYVCVHLWYYNKYKILCMLPLGAEIQGGGHFHVFCGASLWVGCVQA